MGQLTTGATTTTHRPKIAIPGHRSRGFELFIELIFELAALIGDRVHLRGFRRAAGLQAILFGAGQELLPRQLVLRDVESEPHRGHRSSR